MQAHGGERKDGRHRGHRRPRAGLTVLPNANFLIKYTKKDTGDALQGDEARELTMRNYGPGEWWLLLDPA